jgi:uncharacterized YccA/Bax inhibitor family protein
MEMKTAGGVLLTGVSLTGVLLEIGKYFYYVLVCFLCLCKCLLWAFSNVFILLTGLLCQTIERKSDFKQQRPYKPYRIRGMFPGHQDSEVTVCSISEHGTAACTASVPQIMSGNAATIMAVLSTAKIAGFVALGSVLASMFKPQWAPVTAPTYALCKGVALAGLSAMLEARYPGIAMNAVLLTFSTAGSLFFALKARLITLTDKFADTVRAVTGGYFIAMLLLLVLNMFGMRMPGLLSSGEL